jgi:hypothetical protein
MKLGFKKSPPAYLSLLQGPAAAANLTLAIKALTGGVSFASGGAGVLDSTVIYILLSLRTYIHLERERSEYIYIP